MEDPERRRATAAALTVVRAQGLAADEVQLVSNSNKIILRIRPADVVARVARSGQMDGTFELELARRLSAAGAPVVSPDPRLDPAVHAADGFVITLWAYADSSPAPTSPQDYALALQDLHRGMRDIHLLAPHATERIASAHRLVVDPVRSPALGEADRELLTVTLTDAERALRLPGSDAQLLHGEPHPGNLLATSRGPLFVDLETCCRGPVEFDVAHAPPEVADHYPDLDPGLLRRCRILVLAMITAWRWDPEDHFPGGLELAGLWVEQLRAAGRGSPDLVPRMLPRGSRPLGAPRGALSGRG